MDLLMLDRLPAQLRDAVTVRDLQPGQVLFQQGEAVSAFFIVESGRVKLVCSLNGEESGEESVTLQTAGKGESLAEIALFAKTYPGTAIADIRSQVIAYSKPQFLAAVQDYPALAEDFLLRLVRKISSLQLRLGLRDIRGAHDRVMHYLCYLSQAETSMVIQFNCPLREVAMELGLTPETLSRALNRLEQEGRISRQNQAITLRSSSAA